MQLVLELTDELDAKLRTRAAAAGFNSLDEYFVALVNAEVDAADADPLDDPRLEAILVERLDSANAGEVTQLDCDRSRQRAGLPVSRGATA